MKVLIVGLFFVIASVGIQSKSEPNPMLFNRGLAVIYGHNDASGSSNTVVALRGRTEKILHDFLPVGVSEKQNDVLLVRPGSQKTGMLWVWNLQDASPRVLFDVANWPKIKEKPIDYSPAYDENYLAVTDGYHKVWLLSLSKKRVVNFVDIPKLRQKLGLATGDFPTFGPYISLNPSGTLLAINLPAASAPSYGKLVRHSAMTYVMDLNTRHAKFLGPGSPVGWVGNWKVLCRNPDGNSLRQGATIYSVDGGPAKSIPKIYKAGFYGDAPAFARQDEIPNFSRKLNWVEIWNRDLSIRCKAIPLDQSPLPQGALRVIRLKDGPKLPNHKEN